MQKGRQLGVMHLDNPAIVLGIPNETCVANEKFRLVPKTQDVVVRHYFLAIVFVLFLCALC